MRRALSGDRRGAVYVEFLIVILPLLMLWLGLTQIGLMYGAHLLVCHAAARAARAAIVILPDNFEGEYAEAVNTVGNGTSGEQAALDNYAGVAANSRLRSIQQAAALTLAPVMASVTQTVASLTGSTTTVSRALQDSALWDGGGSLARALGAAANTLTGSSSVAVTFPGGPDSYRGRFGPRDPVTTRVTMLYKCSVPLVSGLICRGVSERAAAELNTVLPVGVEWFRFSGVHFTALSAERTLPNQGI